MICCGSASMPSTGETPGRESSSTTMTRFETMVRLDKIGVTSEAERERRMDLATVLLMTVRGIPIIYYGDEQYLANYHLFELNGLLL